MSTPATRPRPAPATDTRPPIERTVEQVAGRPVPRALALLLRGLDDQQQRAGAR
jgi:hypothetical protein